MTEDPRRLDEMCAAALARDGGRPAVEYEGHWYGWGEMRRVADRVARLLEASGAAADAPVTFVPRNRPSSLATLLALLRQRRTVRMVHVYQSPIGIARDIGRLQSPAVILMAEDLSDEVREALARDGMAGIALNVMDADPVAGLERARARPGLTPPAEPRIEILTSGTTGPPKHFPITHRMIADFLVGGPGALSTPEDWSAVPPYLLYFPLGNISGIYSSVPTLIKGQRAVLHDRFSLDKWREFVVRYRPPSTGVPPAAMHMLLEADIPAEDLSSLKAMSTGAAPLDPTLQRVFEERYNIPVLLSYGATEFGGPVTSMTPELHAQWGTEKFGSVGRAFGGAQLRIVDPETGAVLPPGQEGLLEVISPRIGPDWIRTSDIAMIDADGFLFHRGRADGAIVRGGFKLLPEAIERALLLHPAVAAAGVVGVPDSRLGEVPGAAVQAKTGAQAPGFAELEAHLRQHVSAPHIPVHWRLVDSLPTNRSFKIDRSALRQLFRD